MIALSSIEEVPAPPLVPVEQPIDLDHLSRMTLGERSLEREVLALFDRQAAMLLARMNSPAPVVVIAAAHTLKGSARGIGAWRVASAAEAVEQAVGDEAAALMAALRAAVEEASVAIAGLLRAH
jgi:hypothetical protein